MGYRIGDIQPNPFRHMERYPIRRDKVEALRESLRTTGFWDNVVARVNGDGEPQIAYGHHRLTALREEYDSDHEVSLIIRELSDEDMLKIMARENMEEWGTSAAVEHETVRAVVEAYGAGLVEVASPPATGGEVRAAPGFLIARSARCERPYTAQTVAEFLGWTTPSGRAQDKVTSALGALELIEDGVLSEDDFNGMTTKQAQAVVSQAQQARRDREAEAKVRAREAEDQRKKAEAAEKARAKAEEERRKRDEQAARAKNEEARRKAQDQADEAERRAREAENRRKEAERRRKEAQTRAEKEREKGRQEAQNVGRGVGEEMRSGRVGYREAGQAANRYRTDDKKNVPPDIGRFIDRLSVQLAKVLEPDSKLAAEIEEVIAFQTHASDTKIGLLVGALRVVRTRLENYETRLGSTITDADVIAGELEVSNG